jgi:AcrR family transcriptional regulator
MTARGDATRALILASALDLFAEKGFFGTSMPEIAKRAGLGAASLYRHFESKEALVRAVYESATEEFADRLWRSFEPTGSPRKDLQQVWKRLSRIVEERTSLVVFLEMHYHGPYLGESHRDEAEPAYEKLLQLILEGQRQGLIRRDEPGELALFIAAVFFGLARSCIRFGRLLDRKRLEKAEPLVWAAIRA